MGEVRHGVDSILRAGEASRQKSSALGFVTACVRFAEKKRPRRRRDVFLAHKTFAAAGRTDAEASGLTRAAHDLGMDILVEVHEEAELARALPLETRLVGVNNRDLRTFKISLDVCERLPPKIPQDRIAVGEDGIHTPHD